MTPPKETSAETNATASRQMLLEALRVHAQYLGRTPTRDDLDSLQGYTLDDYEAEFDSFEAALGHAGLDPEHAAEVLDEDDLLSELTNLADQFGRPPTKDNMQNHGQYNPDVYTNIFGSWEDAIDAAGLDPEAIPGTTTTTYRGPQYSGLDDVAAEYNHLSDEDVIDEIQRVANIVDHPPTWEEMEEQAEFPAKVAIVHFEGWTDALNEAGFDVSQYRGRVREVSEADLVEELQRLHEELGHPPTTTEMNNQGKFSYGVYYSRFGSWDNALDAAFDDDVLSERKSTASTSRRKISDDDVLDAIRTVADDLGRPPTSTEASEYGDHSWGALGSARFGSWQNAIEEAGLDVDDLPTRSTGTQRIAEEDLLDDLRRLEDELGHPPRIVDVNENGEYSSTPYLSRFDSWKDALAEAGIDTDDIRSRRIDKADLISELQRLAEEVGEQPTTTVMNEQGEYSATTYTTRFGSWRNALEEAGLVENGGESRGRKKIPEEELVNELRRLGVELGHAPSTTEMNTHGDFSATTYANRFGTWGEALQKAGFTDTDTDTDTDNE